MIILDCVQGEKEWMEARRAIPTSSCFSKIITASGNLSGQWDKYLATLCAEYIDPEHSVANRVYTKAMKQGNEREPAARKLYEDVAGYKVREVGGLYLDDSKSAMCSPDGLIESIKTGWETKCPNLDTHWLYLSKNKVPDQYVIQVQSGMAFAKYEKWVFMSYHPKYKPLIIDVDADRALIKKIQQSVAYFNTELTAAKAEIDSYNLVEF